MQRRNSYRDLGLTVSVSVFICILVKCLLFGFTWVSLLWLIFTCAYFYVTWRYPSEGAVVKHSTTAFLVLSFLAIVGIALNAILPGNDYEFDQTSKGASAVSFGPRRSKQKE